MLKRLSPMALAIAGALTASAMPAQAATKHEFAKDSILVVYKKDASQKQKKIRKNVEKAKKKA